MEVSSPGSKPQQGFPHRGAGTGCLPSQPACDSLAWSMERALRGGADFREGCGEPQRMNGESGGPGS